MTLPANERGTLDSRSWRDGSDHSISMRLPARRPDRVYVYILWGRNRRPLYIGKARHPWSRLGSHMARKPWADQVQRVECYGYPTEYDALEAERAAILELDPIHNVVRTDPRHVVEERDRWWKAHQERKRVERIERKAQDEKRSREWAARRAAATPKPKPVRKPLPPRTVEADRRPVKVVRWREDIFTPEQLAIVAKVQNRGKPAA